MMKRRWRRKLESPHVDSYDFLMLRRASKKAVALGEGESFGGFADEEFAVGADFVGFGINFDFWGGVVPL